MSGTIRPVTSRIPQSFTTWDETQLPLAAVLQPLWTAPQTEHVFATLTPLSQIPKCSACGAPHPPHSSSHTVLAGRRHSPSHHHHPDNVRPTQTILCHLCHKISNVAHDGHHGSPSKEQVTSTASSAESWTFALPLRLSNNNASTYRVPAITCPLLWYIILDGAAVSAGYWRHVSAILQATLAVVPSHVHVAILVVYPQQQVAVWQIQGKVPQLKRYPPRTDGLAPLLATAAQPVHESFQTVATACRQAPMPPYTTTDATMSASWTWLVTQIALGLKAVGQPAGQRGNGKLPYTGAYVTCLRSSLPSRVDASHLLKSNLCAATALTVQSVGILEPTAIAADPAFPIMTHLEVPTLVWFATADMHNTNNSDEDDVIHSPGWDTWQALWPWQRAYGAQLRLRLSPGLVTEHDEDDTVDHKSLSHIALPKQRGLTGPAVTAPQATDLWILPSLDAHTTLVVDLALDEDAETSAAAAAPKGGLLQACLAYTALETDEDGQAWTVRRIQLSHRTFQRVATVESLYRQVDPEALAVVLLQKLVRCDPQERLSIGQEWLHAFLVAVYESAVEEEKRQIQLQKHGITDDEGYFLPAERLLSRQAEGSSTATDILLAQGHGRLQPVALLLYLLLQQCQNDGSSSSDTSMLDFNRHGLSLPDLLCMSPEALSRCLAPRLQLWSGDKVLVDLIDLRYESVVRTIREEASLRRNPYDVLLLVLDAPDQIVVANALACLPDSKERPENIPDQLGPKLESLLHEMATSYPTPPPILYGGGGDGVSWLTHVCKEDLPLIQPDGTVIAQNFDAWRTQIAQAVRKELQLFNIEVPDEKAVEV